MIMVIIETCTCNPLPSLIALSDNKSSVANSYIRYNSIVHDSQSTGSTRYIIIRLTGWLSFLFIILNSLIKIILFTIAALIVLESLLDHLAFCCFIATVYN